MSAYSLYAYTNMENLDQKIQQGIETYMRNKQFNYSKIQSHEHNGVDTIRINEKDLINSDMYSLGLLSWNDGSGNDTFYIENPPYFKSITFYGIASDGIDTATGSLVGAVHTAKCITTGEVQLGNLFEMVQKTFDTFGPGNALGETFYQTYNSIYITLNDLTKTFVTSGRDAFAIAFDGTNKVAELTITAIEKNRIVIKGTFTGTWYIEGFLLFS